MAFPFLGAAAAALPIVGDLINYRSQSNTNAASAHEAALNRDFQESLSNTAYQRATQDMKSAGLNPMLAYSQGGASTPGGSTASFSAPKVSGLQESANRYQDIMTSSATASKDQSQANVNRALVDKTLEEARVARSTADRQVVYNAGMLGEDEKQKYLQTNLLGNQEASSAKFYAEQARREEAVRRKEEALGARARYGANRDRAFDPLYSGAGDISASAADMVRRAKKVLKEWYDSDSMRWKPGSSMDKSYTPGDAGYEPGGIPQ